MTLHTLTFTQKSTRIAVSAFGSKSSDGSCPPPCVPDIDGNGQVQVDDLLNLLAAFGWVAADGGC